MKLELCSKRWLVKSGEHLIEAKNNINEAGTTLVHGNIRSDNICIKKNKIVFVDWSNASIGNSEHDLANLLPTLYLEGGPPPYQIMPDAANWASYLCAKHIKRLSKGNSIPLWRTMVFKKIIIIELEWAAQCLNLDRPDGLKLNQLHNF